MITDVLYSVNMYILFCVKRSELSHVMDHCAIEVLCIFFIYFYFIIAIEQGV